MGEKPIFFLYTF